MERLQDTGDFNITNLVSKNIKICEYCEGTGEVEIDPIGPEQDSHMDICSCQVEEGDDDVWDGYSTSSYGSSTESQDKKINKQTKQYQKN